MSNTTKSITEGAKTEPELTFEERVQLQIQEYIDTNRHGPIDSPTYTLQRPASPPAKRGRQ
jgi:hypothetical protein